VVDVLDHVLDKGVVIDAWVRVALAGIDLLTAEARIVVASIQTYVSEASRIAQRLPSAAPRLPALPRARWSEIEEQLRRIRRQLDSAPVLVGRAQQRAEDRILEELRDARARIVAPDRAKQRQRRRRRTSS
jgi:gas vesicle structural protein